MDEQLMGESSDFLAGYRSGLLDGIRQERPFHGKERVVTFDGSGPQYQSVIAYEQALIRAIPVAYENVQRRKSAADRCRGYLEDSQSSFDEGLAARGSVHGERGLLRRLLVHFETRTWIDAGSSEIMRRREEVALEEVAVRAEEEVVEWILNELTQTRQWLDAFLLAAEEYFGRRPLLRRTPEPEPCPAFVKTYKSEKDYVAEDPRRGLSREFDPLKGMDFGYDWSWLDYDRPWFNTKWRVSYIEEIGEVYAVRLWPSTSHHFSWAQSPTPVDRPVWLLRSGFLAKTGARSLWWEPTEEIQALGRIQARLMRSPNSLLALAEEFHTATSPGAGTTG